VEKVKSRLMSEFNIKTTREMGILSQRGQGWRKVDDYYEVVKGLKPGDRVVTSANFLIDSESNLKEALGGMAGMEHGGHGK
jgi:Cu(I)/Ag(I) efflux system membrane fusion protein